MREKIKKGYKKFLAGGGLYIALALCILTVISLAVYSSIRSAVTSIGEGTPTQDDAVTNTGNQTETTDKTDKTDPPKNEQSSIDTAVPIKVSYSYPVVGQISKNFSDETLVFSVTMNDYRTHSGLDISGIVGSAVKASADGIITAVYADPLMGQTIEITHADGMISRYQNLSATLPQNVEVGVEVKGGDIIGGIGETALIECAEEPHLHLEFITDGEKVNPKNYIQ